MRWCQWNICFLEAVHAFCSRNSCIAIQNRFISLIRTRLGGVFDYQSWQLAHFIQFMQRNDSDRCSSITKVNVSSSAGLYNTLCSTYKYNKRNSYNFWTNTNLYMKPIATKSENWDFYTLCSINLNMASISGTGNVQSVLNLKPCVMKHLWYDIVDRITNSFM